MKTERQLIILKPRTQNIRESFIFSTSVDIFVQMGFFELILNYYLHAKNEKLL